MKKWRRSASFFWLWLLPSVVIASQKERAIDNQDVTDYHPWVDDEQGAKSLQEISQPALPVVPTIGLEMQRELKYKSGSMMGKSHKDIFYYKGKGYKGYKGKGFVTKGKGKGKGGYYKKKKAFKKKHYYKGKGKGYFKGKGKGYWKGYWKGKGKGYYYKKKKTQTPQGPTIQPTTTTAAPVAPSVQPTLSPRVPTTSPTIAPTLGCSECRAECIAITDFVLVDANQDLNTGDPPADYLVFLEEGAEYSLSALQAQFGTTDFALLCVTLPLPFDQQPFQIGSVGLRDNIYRTHEGTAGNNSGKDFNSEGSPPYTLADDDSGNYNPTDFTLGEDWSISCQAFCERNLLGEESALVTRTFRMVA